jgi:hypothetical protein
MHDVRTHVGEASPYDDLTLITFGVIDPQSRWRDDPTLNTDGQVALTLREEELRRR